jgi:hypothetical protein
VLLTVKFEGKKEEAGAPGGGGAAFYSTQTTLQNVEVFAVGTTESAIQSGAEPATKDAQKETTNKRGGDGGAIVLLVDHQDAVILKFVKDVDGIVDLVLRSADDAQIVRTDGMSNDTLIDRFKFRVPLQAGR